MTTRRPVLVLGEDAHVLWQALQVARQSMTRTPDGWSFSCTLDEEQGPAVRRALGELRATCPDVDRGLLLLRLAMRVRLVLADCPCSPCRKYGPG